MSTVNNAMNLSSSALNQLALRGLQKSSAQRQEVTHPDTQTQSAPAALDSQRADSIEITDAKLSAVIGTNHVEGNLLNVLREVFTDDQIKSLVSGKELSASEIWDGVDPAAQLRGLIDEMKREEIQPDSQTMKKYGPGGIDAVGAAKAKAGKVVPGGPGFMGYTATTFKLGFDYFDKYSHRLSVQAVRNLTDNDKVFVGLLYAKAEERTNANEDAQEFKKADKIAYQLVIYNMSHDIGEELKAQEKARKERAASGKELSDADPAQRIRDGKNPEAPDTPGPGEKRSPYHYIDTTQYSREDEAFRRSFDDPATAPRIDLDELRAQQEARAGGVTSDS